MPVSSALDSMSIRSIGVIRTETAWLFFSLKFSILLLYLLFQKEFLQLKAEIVFFIGKII
ncbi:hypothetical protein DD829_00430 [Chryseobacterium sp. HMWF035]|nr:hypothetical protein DD829_00430 [Chryseobacterium sp. HMWF035]